MDLTRFLINRMVALGEGVDDQRASQLALLGSLISGDLAIGLFIVREMARQEAPPPPVMPISPTPADDCCKDALAAAEEAGNLASAANSTAIQASTAAAEAQQVVAQLTLRVSALEKRKTSP
jgi:hypothetical protein